jgi:hypothetical protein
MSWALVNAGCIMLVLVFAAAFLAVLVAAVTEPSRRRNKRLEKRRLAKERLALSRCPNCENEYGMEAAERAANDYDERCREPRRGMVYVPDRTLEVWEVKCPTCDQVSEFLPDRNEIRGLTYEERCEGRRFRQEWSDRLDEFGLPRRRKSTGA